jgi:hypothetical protein
MPQRGLERSRVHSSAALPQSQLVPSGHCGGAVVISRGWCDEGYGGDRHYIVAPLGRLAEQNAGCGWS